MPTAVAAASEISPYSLGFPLSPTRAHVVWPVALFVTVAQSPICTPCCDCCCGVATTNGVVPALYPPDVWACHVLSQLCAVGSPSESMLAVPLLLITLLPREATPPCGPLATPEPKLKLCCDGSTLDALVPELRLKAAGETEDEPRVGSAVGGVV